MTLSPHLLVLVLWGLLDGGSWRMMPRIIIYPFIGEGPAGHANAPEERCVQMWVIASLSVVVEVDMFCCSAPATFRLASVHRVPRVLVLFGE